MATDGGDDTINRGAYATGEAGRFPDILGPSLRMILDFADLDRSRFIIAGGQSGNPLSAHYPIRSSAGATGIPHYRRRRRRRATLRPKPGG